MKFLLLILSLLAAPAFAMTMDEAWKTLGLAPGADAEAIKKAHRSLAKKYHPDVTGGDKAAEARLVEVNIANDILLGKRAPSGPDGRAAGGPKGGGFRDFGFEDFTADLRRQQRAKETYRAPEDAFVRRFFLQREEALSPALKKSLEDYVRLAEKLFANKMTAEVVKLQGSVEEATGHAGLARKIFFTLMGEQVQRYGTRKQADETLKAYLLGKSGPGLESALAELVAYEGSTRLKGPRGKWASTFPETTKAVLIHPGLSQLSRDTQRVLFLSFLSEAEDPVLAGFYRDLWRQSPTLRGRRAEQQVKKLFESNPNPKPTEGEVRRRTQEIIDTLRQGGPEFDIARVRIYESLLDPGLDPRKYPEFMAEIRKIQDFSAFHLRRGLGVGIFGGLPEVAAARQNMIKEMLQMLRERDPGKFAEEKLAFPKTFEQWGTKGWEPVLDFINPLLAEAGAPAVPTAESKMQAERCAREYGRISRVIGGMK